MLTVCIFHPSALIEQDQAAKRDAFIADGGYAAARLFEIDHAGVTNAFMDSFAMRDNFAALWLGKYALRWLKPVADLTVER